MLLFRLHEAFVELVVSLGIVFVALIGQNGFLAVFQIGFNLRMDVFAADDEAVGIVDGGLGEGEVIGFLEGLEVFGAYARNFHLLLETRAEHLIKSIVVDGINDFRVAVQGIVFH